MQLSRFVLRILKVQKIAAKVKRTLSYGFSMVCFSSKSAYSCSEAEVTGCALSYALLALCAAASCDFAFPK